MIVVELKSENGDDPSDARRGGIDEVSVSHDVTSSVAATGARMLTLPQDVVDRLGLTDIERMLTTNEDGGRGELQVAGPIDLRIGGKCMQVECIIVPTSTEALAAEIFLERLDLIAGCVNLTLSPYPVSPNRPLLRM